MQFKYGTHWGDVRGSSSGTITEIELSNDKYINYITGKAGDILDHINLVDQSGFVYETGSNDNFEDSGRSVFKFMTGRYCSSWFGHKAICDASFVYSF